jgi:hypothetical protein
MTGMPPQRAVGSRPPQRAPEQPSEMDQHEALAEEIVRRLEERGLPTGAWLADVMRVRRALHEADTLLRRLQEAIIEEARPSPRAES